MWRSGGRWRKRRVCLAACTAVLLLGGLAAYSRLDRERHASDAARLAVLAAADLPVQDSKRGDWPQWRGPNRDGLSPETGLLTCWPADGPRVVWKKPIGRGFSSIAVAGGRLYTMEKAGTAEGVEAVVCLDVDTGKEVWRFRYPNHFDERFGSGPRSTPAVDGNFVYAVGPTGIFHCLRADTGEKVWRHDLAQEFSDRPMRYGVSFSPLVEGDLVYTMPGGPNGNAVAAFDKRTGALAWNALHDEIGYSSPVAMTAGGVRQVLFFTNSALVSLSPHDGKLLWRYPWRTENGFNIATPIVVGNYAFISSAYGKGCALLEVTADAAGSLRVGRVYEHNRMRNYFASSVRYGEHIYGLDMTDLVCLAVRTGEVAWRKKGARSFRKGSLLIADGHIILLGEQGALTLARATPDGYQVEASHRVSQNKCWTVPALAGGKLYVRDESSIVCLDLKTTSFALQSHAGGR